MIKNGDHHVSLGKDNGLFLSKVDPFLILYKHSDGTIRDEQGSRCLHASFRYSGIIFTGKRDLQSIIKA